MNSDIENRVRLEKLCQALWWLRVNLCRLVKTFKLQQRFHRIYGVNVITHLRQPERQGCENRGWCLYISGLVNDRNHQYRTGLCRMKVTQSMRVWCCNRTTSGKQHRNGS